MVKWIKKTAEYFTKADVLYPEKQHELQWFTLFAWNKENRKNWKTCGQLAW